MFGRRSAALLAGPLSGLLALIALFGVPLAAQENPDTNVIADSQLAGVVRAPDGTPIPGSTVRVTETVTGKAWVTWTDENGAFEFPALPSGHYRVEVLQLGFLPASKEADLASGVKSSLDLKMDVSTLAAITAPAATENPLMPNAPQANQSTNAAAPAFGAANVGSPAPSNQPATATSNAAPVSPGGTRGQRGAGGHSGQQGGPGGGTGGGRRAFQQVGLNGTNENPAEGGTEDQNLPETTTQLGQASSADAVQMIGTVAMGLVPAAGFPQPGEAGPGGPGGFGAGGYSIPGQGGPGGGPMGGPGSGSPGSGPVFVQRGGGGRGRGIPGGSEGLEALWGAERVKRLTANRMHYSIYNVFGDSALNARPYSLTQPNPPKISSWTETAGMNIGGPLKIPHVYNGTDKTFFYINFGGTWSRSPVDEFATVPTASERAGDFSADNVQLYDPLSNLTGPRTLMTNAGCAEDAASAPGTCIPQSRISQQSLALLNYIPLPNLPGQTLNYHLQTNVPGLSNRLNVNVAHQISSKLSLQVNYNLTNATSHSLNNFPGIEANTFARGQSAMIGLTQNWTKSFMHTSTLYFSRNRSLGLNEFSNLADITQELGIAGVSPQPFDFGLPTINLTNYTGLDDPTPYLSRSQTWRYVDSLRWMKEKHTITVGGEIRKIDINRDTDPTPNGQFSFTGLMTSQLTSAGAPLTSPANCGPANPSVPCIGNDFADFLLGYPGNTKIQFGDTSTYFRNWGFLGYASDDWHMFPKFTLTYGLRYEAFTPPTEINGHIANLAVSSNFTQAQCVTPIAADNCALGANASLFNGHYNNWAPRVGIAWQPPGKWFSGKHELTVRAGFSMFYVQSYLNTLAGEMANQPPFATANTLATLSGTSATLLTLQNGFPASAIPTNALTNTVAVDPNYQVPYATIWNFGIEYNLAQATFFEVMYTGTRGVHLDQLLGYSLATHTTRNAAGFTYDTSGAFSNFDALQVRLQKRMSHGLMFIARYTYSKSLDDASTIGGGAQTVIQDNADPRADYGLSSFNMEHQFFGLFTYQLPFGDRQRFAKRGWEKHVFGAWRVNSSFTANSGTPYTVRVFSKNTLCQNVPGINSERADQTAIAALPNPAVQEWFNRSAFSIPTACFGDAPRNSVIGPGTFTINSGLTKTVQFGRDGLRRLDFRWNAYNLPNHPNFSGLSTVLGSKTFGEITSVGAMRTMTFSTRLNF